MFNQTTNEPWRNANRKHIFFIITFLLACFLALVAGEVLSRYLWRYTYFKDERNLCYRHDEELGWFPVPGSHIENMGGRSISILHNADGFRDINHGAKSKKRIAFLGDSFVWGFDANTPERFTDKLQTLLPACDIMNLGVSGYGTDQEFLLLQKWQPRYRPDVVVLLFNENDWQDNNARYVYNGYYKPYFKTAKNKLVLCGVPVPKSLNYYYSQHPLLLKSRLLQMLIKGFEKWNAPDPNTSHELTFAIIKEMKQYVESHGAKFKLVFAFNWEHEQKLAFCQSKKINCLFLGENEMLPGGGHWSPAGNDSVCAKIYRNITNNPE